MKNQLPIIFTLAIITLTCKTNLDNIKELTQALKTIQNAKQIVLETQAIKANTELGALIQTIETEAELEAQKIVKEEEAAEEQITQEFIELREANIKNKQEEIKHKIQTQKNKMTQEKIAIIRQDIINQIKLTILDRQTLINIHTDPNWPEPYDHFGMTDRLNKSRPFNYIGYSKENILYDNFNKKDISHLPYINIRLANHHNAPNRRRIYLILKYDTKTIQQYGDILHELKLIGKKNTAQDIIYAIIRHCKYYYDTAITTLNDKQDKLHILHIEQLYKLQTAFKELEQQKQNFDNYLIQIVDEYSKQKAQSQILSQQYILNTIDKANQLSNINDNINNIAQNLKTILDEIQ
ncbi:CRASP family complement regulator-acquiring lipoprotein [Borrelia persica]|uniref:CRASP family complement regulator-acquiring lipoprotein n=1 Tax=Borrelia persica TaxID=44448 RepID=UPI0004661BC3|nr:CRASP family complement regulator-acquiring lipoprotein [Borrelia persica]